MAIIKISTNMNDGEDVEKRNPLTFDGNVNWYILYPEQYGFLKILKQAQYDPRKAHS